MNKGVSPMNKDMQLPHPRKLSPYEEFKKTYKVSEYVPMHMIDWLDKYVRERMAGQDWQSFAGTADYVFDDLLRDTKQLQVFYRLFTWNCMYHLFQSSKHKKRQGNRNLTDNAHKNAQKILDALDVVIDHVFDLRFYNSEYGIFFEITGEGDKKPTSATKINLDRLWGELIKIRKEKWEEIKNGSNIYPLAEPYLLKLLMNQIKADNRDLLPKENLDRVAELFLFFKFETLKKRPGKKGVEDIRDVAERLRQRYMKSKLIPVTA
jgi:hypothetical protein